MSILLPNETQRLRFRRVTPDDLDFVASMLGHPEVTRYYPKAYSREEAVQWIEKQLRRYENDGHGLWLVSENETQQPVGQVGLMIQEVDGRKEPEIGWMIHFPFWRRHYATEAALSVRSLAFETMNLPYVISLIRPENTPSQGVARKLGMNPIRETMFHGFNHLVFYVEASNV